MSTAAEADLAPSTPAVGCYWCTGELDKEEAADPRDDGMGNAICDECWRDHNCFTCHWCEADEEDTEGDGKGCRVGSLFVVFEPTPARYSDAWDSGSHHWFNHSEHEMRPGVYWIKRWPIYTGGYLSAGLHTFAFKWFAPLPAKMQRGGYAEYSCGPLCEDCQWKLKHAKWHWPPTEWTGRRLGIEWRSATEARKDRVEDLAVRNAPREQVEQLLTRLGVPRNEQQGRVAWDALPLATIEKACAGLGISLKPTPATSEGANRDT